MGCFGDREASPPEQKARWEYITLSDFRSRSCWTPVTYGWMWLLGLIGVAVYAVDTFTAVNLLAFNKWSSQVQPYIPFEYSKWIFSGCIIFSWALCFYEWIRAIRVIKKDGVAASYMDPLANSLQSMRKNGWRRFLVFTALTQSKKGTDYVAFFVYFSFKTAIRVVIAEGPRQVVNAFTLYAVMQAQLIDRGTPGSTDPGASQFFANLKVLADQNAQQAVIYASMLFTLVIWVFSALCLIVSGVLYLVFLWHYIPKEDGRLRVYCRRKIDRRLEKIVAKKVQAAIEDEARQREKSEKKAELKRQKTGELAPPAPPKLNRQPTLPNIDDTAIKSGDNEMLSLGLKRNDTSSTISTLPVYSSRPPTRQDLERQPTLPDLGTNADRPAIPSRNNTTGSTWTNHSSDLNAPLIANAAWTGINDRVPSPAPTYASRQQSNFSQRSRPIPDRSDTQASQCSQRSFTPGPMLITVDTRLTQNQRFPVRSNTAFSFENELRSATTVRSPLGQDTDYDFPPQPKRQDSETSYFSRPVPGAPPRMPTFGSMRSHQSSSTAFPPTPAPQRKPLQTGASFSRPLLPSTNQPPPNSYEMTSQPLHNGFTAFNTTPTTPLYEGPRRNVTVAGPAIAELPGSHFAHAPRRSATAPIELQSTPTPGVYTPYQGPQYSIERRGPTPAPERRGR